MRKIYYIFQNKIRKRGRGLNIEIHRVAGHELEIPVVVAPPPVPLGVAKTTPDAHWGWLATSDLHRRWP
jgi:hypothetical protein